MRKSTKIYGALLILVAACYFGVDPLFRFLDRRAERQVIAIVAELSPGTSYSVAVQRLGQPVETHKDGDQIEDWVRHVGSHVEPEIAHSSVLHVFTHSGPAYRYVLVFTDRESQKVVYANWCSM
ncbi:MAG TPA: hypothetical protein VG796_28220 [Verrucomicrobiales bacterium]|nr:hypothetical protein [Verrucomicrobiales bacterium]